MAQSGRIEVTDVVDYEGLVNALTNIEGKLDALKTKLKAEAGNMKLQLISENDTQTIARLSSAIEAVAAAMSRWKVANDANKAALQEVKDAVAAEIAASKLKVQQLKEEEQALKNQTQATKASAAEEARLAAEKKREEQAEAQSAKAAQQSAAAREREAQAARIAATVEGLLHETIKMETLSYNELSAAVSALGAKLKNMSATEKETTADGRKMVEVTKMLNMELARQDAMTGRYSRNVGNYKSAFDGLGFSIQQVIREVPSAINIQQFFLAISNNIPMVADQIQYFRAEQKGIRENLSKMTQGTAEYAAESAKLIPLWKKISRSIFSWQTGIIAILLLLRKIPNIIENIKKKLAGLVNNLIAVRRTYNEVVTDAQKSIQDEITELKALRSEMDRTVKGSKDWGEIISRVNELTNSTLNTISATPDEVDRVTEAYIKQAKQIAINKQVVDKLAETDVNQFKRKMVSDTSLWDQFNTFESIQEQIGGVLGIQRYKEGTSDLTDEYKKLQKLVKYAFGYMPGRGKLLMPSAHLIMDWIYKYMNAQTDQEKRTLMGQDVLKNANGSGIMFNGSNKKNAKRLAEFIQSYTPVLSASSYDAISELYDAIITPDPKKKHHKSKNTESEYEDFFTQYIESRYNLLEDEYDRERAMTNDKYLSEVMSARKEYQEKQDTLLEYYRWKLGIEKEDADGNETDWKRQVMDSVSYQAELGRMSRQHDEIRKAQYAEYVKEIQDVDAKYIDGLLENYDKEYDAFVKKENAQTKAYEKNISRRNKTLADNYKKNKSTIDAIDAYELKKINLREKRREISRKANQDYADIRSAILSETDASVPDWLRGNDSDGKDAIKSWIKSLPSKMRTDKNHMYGMEWDLELGVYNQIAATATDRLTKAKERIDKGAAELTQAVDNDIQSADADIAKLLSQIDLTKEFNRESLDHKIVEGLFGLKNQGKQMDYVLRYYEKLARETAKAAGKNYEDVLNAYAEMLNRQNEDLDLSVVGGRLQAEGSNAQSILSAQWSDIFKDRFLENFDIVKDGIVQMRDTVMDSVGDMINAWIELAEARAEAAAEETEVAKEEYERQKSLMDAGYANSMETAWAEYQEKKQIQEQAERDAKAAQEAQERMNTATQISELITAVAKIYDSMASAGAVGVVLATVASAAMIASFTQSKIMAAKAAKYGEGHVEYIGYGGTHASGNDNPLAFDAQGRERRMERGEIFGVISRKSIAKYGRQNVLDLFNSVNKGTYEADAVNSIGRQYAVATMPSTMSQSVRLDKIESALQSIDEKTGNQTYVTKDGTIVTKVGNNVKRTRIVRAS